MSIRTVLFVALPLEVQGMWSPAFLRRHVIFTRFRIELARQAKRVKQAFVIERPTISACWRTTVRSSDDGRWRGRSIDPRRPFIYDSGLCSGIAAQRGTTAFTAVGATPAPAPTTLPLSATTATSRATTRCRRWSAPSAAAD